MKVSGSDIPPVRISALPPEQRQIMVFSDEDDSMVADNPDGLARSRDVLDRYAPLTTNGFCTGRGPTVARHLADAMRGFPMMFFSTNNGQNLFLNRRDLPADEFVRGLRMEDQDPAWAEHVRAVSGWDIGTVRCLLESVLRSDGFKPTGAVLPHPYESCTAFEKWIPGEGGRENVTVYLPSDQPTFQIRNPFGPLGRKHQACGEALAARVVNLLEDRGIACNHGTYARKDHIHHFLQPRAVTKRALLEHMLSLYPSVRSVVTIGDNVNDDMLDPEKIGPVTNYPILAGDAHPRIQQLSHHPRLRRSTPGDVGPAIQDQIQAIEHRSAGDLPVWVDEELGR